MGLGLAEKLGLSSQDVRNNGVEQPNRSPERIIEELLKSGLIEAQNKDAALQVLQRLSSLQQPETETQRAQPFKARQPHGVLDHDVD